MMDKTPWSDLVELLAKPSWTTPVYWLILAGAIVIARRAWRRNPAQRTARHLALWVLRVTMGTMWWQQSLWKVPPHFDGLRYWMEQMAQHAVFPLQGQLVGAFVVPNITVFGPLVYLTEVAIGVSLMLGLWTRLGALAGLGMGAVLWLGLYSAPGEWPWTYGYLIVIQALFVIDPPGRSLGVEAD